MSFPSTITASLPEGFKIRKLQKSDKTDLLELLEILTTVGEITQDAWDNRFEYISEHSDTYTVLCIVDENDRVCATGSLIVERKFIHNCGLVGHVEDIAVSKAMQGKKLGISIIQALDYTAQQNGCYKTILDCSDSNRGFYEKCGFKFAGCEMARYYN